MAYVAEIYTGHPEFTTTGQVDRLSVAKTLSAGDYATIVCTIAFQQEAQEAPRNDHLAILLADGRQVKVCKYAPAEGFAEGQRVRIAKKQYLSAAEALEDLIQQHRTAHGSTRSEAIDAVAQTYPKLWARYAHAPRIGRGNSALYGPTSGTEPEGSVLSSEKSWRRPMRWSPRMHLQRNPRPWQDSSSSTTDTGTISRRIGATKRVRATRTIMTLRLLRSRRRRAQRDRRITIPTATCGSGSDARGPIVGLESLPRIITNKPCIINQPMSSSVGRKWQRSILPANINPRLPG